MRPVRGVLTWLRPRLTYANTVSTLCLFVLLGGSAYAALKLEKNSVRSVHIKDGQVKTPDLAGSAVTGEKVANGSLASEDFAAGQLPQGPKGEKGDQGERGPTGETGPAGAPNPNAVNSDQLDNLDSSAFLLATGKAADADKLDNLDSSALARAAQTDEDPTLITAGFALPACTDNGVDSPTVTVQVGPAKAVAVWATATMRSTSAGQTTQVQLREATDLPGCPAIMSTTSASAETRTTLPGQTAGTTGLGGFLVIPATQGTRTYSLRFQTPANGGQLSAMRLVVLPL